MKTTFSKHKKEELELYSMLFCLMDKYGSKENFSQELIDLLKLYDINFGIRPEEMLEILKTTASLCPGTPIISFEFAHHFLNTVPETGERLETPLSGLEDEKAPDSGQKYLPLE
jgi:hypothetical protein